MDLNQQLYDYIMLQAPNMTKDWLNTRAEDNTIYSKSSPENITSSLFQQNQMFIQTIAKSLIGKGNFKKWAEELAVDRAKSGTPLYSVMENFKKFRVIFLKYINTFVSENKSDIPLTKLGEWNIHINLTFDVIIEQFIIHYHKVNEELLKLHKDLLMEVSTPVIPLSSKIGILPLVGDIDTYRAQNIKEHALIESNRLQLETLIIDLSGVPYIDTMVANELFQVIKTLSLLGIKGILTGIRPEIAQSAVQLGIDFSNVKTYRNLRQGLKALF